MKLRDWLAHEGRAYANDDAADDLRELTPEQAQAMVELCAHDGAARGTRGAVGPLPPFMLSLLRKAGTSHVHTFSHLPWVLKDPREV
jgi:hypothetical protein